MYKRTLAKTLKEYSNFPVLAIVGPRQSGKTTLVQSSFPKHTFLSWKILLRENLRQMNRKNFWRRTKINTVSFSTNFSMSLLFFPIFSLMLTQKKEKIISFSS